MTKYTEMESAERAKLAFDWNISSADTKNSFLANFIQGLLDTRLTNELRAEIKHG